MKEFALARDAELPGDAERDGGHELGKRHGETPSEQRRTWTGVDGISSTVRS